MRNLRYGFSLSLTKLMSLVLSLFNVLAPAPQGGRAALQRVSQEPEPQVTALQREVQRLRREVDALKRGGAGQPQQQQKQILEEEPRPTDEPICTCEEASKNPLAQEYAYRSGICTSDTRQLGADPVTTECQYAVHAEYNGNGKFNGAEPEIFNASEAHNYRCFDGITPIFLPAGEVTAPWSCTADNSCGDCDPLGPHPEQCSTARGYAMLWVPRNATATTPRILYVHGGSWLYGSPKSASYAPFCATIAQRTGMPVLTIDYTLAPVANFSKILVQVGTALKWLATHDPTRAGRDGAGRAATPLRDAPMVFIAGDSSGGGTATSALLAQAAGSLPGAGGAKFSGGVLYSPWLNLACDTPSYVSQIFKLEEAAIAPEQRQLKCSIPGLDTTGLTQARVAISGDVAFSGYPHTLATSYADNGQTYAGSAAMTRDPIANAMMASETTLANMPPLQIHVGLSEVLVSESAIFSTKMAAAGASAALHMYDQMWHVFSMYYEGCEHPKLSRLLFAESSLDLTSFFFKDLAQNGGDVGAWQSNGVPFTLTHYEYPRGVDAAMKKYGQFGFAFAQGE